MLGWPPRLRLILAISLKICKRMRICRASALRAHRYSLLWRSLLLRLVSPFQLLKVRLGLDIFRQLLYWEGKHSPKSLAAYPHQLCESRERVQLQFHELLCQLGNLLPQHILRAEYQSRQLNSLGLSEPLKPFTLPSSLILKQAKMGFQSLFLFWFCFDLKSFHQIILIEMQSMLEMDL